MTTSRVPVTLSDGDRAELRLRAAAHGLSMSKFLRRSALGNHNAPADDPDAWWDSLTPKRKKQLRSWFSGDSARVVQVDGQMPLLGELPAAADGQPLP